jgi:hypothetical protein
MTYVRTLKAHGNHKGTTNMATQTATHGFQRGEGEAGVYIGGAASRPLKRAIERVLNDLDLLIRVKMSTDYDNPKFQGFSPDNLINRVTTREIHLEQSADGSAFHGEIAYAVAKVLATRWRLLVCILIGRFEQAFPRIYSPATEGDHHVFLSSRLWRAGSNALLASVSEYPRKDAGSHKQL